MTDPAPERRHSTAAFRRLAAFAIDWCVFSVWIAAASAVLWLAQRGDPWWPENAWVGQCLGFLATTLPFATFLVLTESSAWRATIGKRLLALRVVTRSSIGPSRARSLARNALEPLPWELGHITAHQAAASARTGEDPAAWVMAPAILAIAAATWFVASLWIGTGRTPYDRASGTTVERVC